MHLNFSPARHISDINLFCELNIISNANDINAQTTTIEESSNSQL